MKLYEISFSPTGGTKKVLKTVSSAFNCEKEEIDLMDSRQSTENLSFSQDDIVIVAYPVFGGRVPTPCAEKIKTFKGNGAAAILICVFGNRAIDDALMEMKDILTQCDFHCAGAIKAVAEHSIMHQYGKNRPDQEDNKQLLEFGKEIRQKIESGEATADLVVPGNKKYREFGGLPLKPKANDDCKVCALCARRCPTGAIDPKNSKETDASKCITCMQCVAVCPVNARKVSRIKVFISSQKLKKALIQPKKNELYL